MKPHQVGEIVNVAERACESAIELSNALDSALRQLCVSCDLIRTYGERLLSGEPVTTEERAIITQMVAMVLEDEPTYAARREEMPAKIHDLNVAAARVVEIQAAASMITTQILGMREAQRAFKQMPPAAKAAAQQVMDATAERIATDAASRAPVRSGRLKRSIGWRSRPRSVSAAVVVDKDLMHLVHWLEFGTTRMSARPFFRPAVEAARADHLRDLELALRKAGEAIEAAATHTAAYPL